MRTVSRIRGDVRIQRHAFLGIKRASRFAALCEGDGFAVAGTEVVVGNDGVFAPASLPGEGESVLHFEDENRPPTSVS